MSDFSLSREGVTKDGKTIIHPANLSLYLTRLCNLSCPSCLFKLQKKNFFSSSSLPSDSALKIIDYFFSKGSRNIFLQAEGEVLLYPNYWEITKHCRSIGFKIYNLITNGILIDENLLEIINNFRGITISVDGHDPESYRKRRGGTPAIFQRIINNTRLLLAVRQEVNKRFVVAYNCVLLEENYHIMPHMIKLAQELGIDRMQFRNFHSYDFSSPNLRPLYKTPEVSNFIKELKDNTYDLQIMWPELYGPLETFHCQMLFDTVTIGSDGYFAPCCHIPSEENYGSFFLDHEGYNKGPIAAFRRKFLNAKKREDLPRQCWECPRLTARDSN